MMKSILLGAAVATGVAKTTWENLADPKFEYSYALWKNEHGAKFPGSEEAFNANLAEIRKWNSEAHSYKKGVNAVSPPPPWGDATADVNPAVSPVRPPAAAHDRRVALRAA